MMRLPTGIKKVIFPLGILFLFGIIWYGLFKPELEKISKYRSQPTAARSQIESMVRQLNVFNPATAQERAEWASLEKDLNRRLPKGKRIIELYVQLSTLAEKYELQNFKRRELENSEKSYDNGGINHSGYSIELAFECSYSSLAGFLNGLQNIDRLVEVVNLEITRNLPLIGVRIVLGSYFTP